MKQVENYRKTRVSASLLVRVATPEPILPEATFISRAWDAEHEFNIPAFTDFMASTQPEGTGKKGRPSKHAAEQQPSTRPTNQATTTQPSLLANRRPQSSRIASHPKQEERKSSSRPQSARLTRGESLARYTSTPEVPFPGCLAGMFNMAPKEHKQSRERRPSSARAKIESSGATESTPTATSPLRRPQSARIIRSGPQKRAQNYLQELSDLEPSNSPLRRPQSARIIRTAALNPGSSALPSPGVADSSAHHSRQDALEIMRTNKLRVVGRTHLPRGLPLNQKRTNSRILAGQFAPPMILGPTEGTWKLRSRFNKNGGIFLEGVSAAEWTKNRVEAESEPRVRRMSTRKMSIALHNAVRSDSSEVEEFLIIDETNETSEEEEELQQIKEPDPQQLIEEMDLERLRREAEEAELQAKLVIELAQLEMEDLTKERIETSKILVVLEDILQNHLDGAHSDSSGTESPLRSPNGNSEAASGASEDAEGGVGGEADDHLSNLVNIMNERTRRKRNPEKKKFHSQEMTAEKQRYKNIAGSVKEKLSLAMLNRDDWMAFLAEQCLLRGSGGFITEEQAHTTFSEKCLPTSQMMSDEGFLEAIQQLKSITDVGQSTFQKMNDACEVAEAKTKSAHKLFSKVKDVMGMSRIQTRFLEVQKSKGDMKVKHADALLKITRETDVSTLREAIAALYVAVAAYRAARADKEIVPTVRKIIKLSIQLGRFQADQQHYRSANVLIRQVLLLCDDHKLSTLNGQLQINTKTQSTMLPLCPEVEDALKFAQELYEFSEELKMDAAKSCEHAEMLLLLADYDAVMTALLVTEILQNDSLVVRGVVLNDKEEILVLEPPAAIVKGCKKDELTTLAEATEWKWEWVKSTGRTDEWHALANKVIDTLVNSVHMYLSQQIPTQASKFLQKLNQFCTVLGLENPGTALIQMVEQAKRDGSALEAVEALNKAAQSQNTTWQLGSLVVEAFDACQDADDYRAQVAQEESKESRIESKESLIKSKKALMWPKSEYENNSNSPRCASKTRFWENKWLEAGRDALSQVSNLGIQCLAKTRDNSVQKNTTEELVTEDSRHADVTTKDSAAQRIQDAQKMLETGRLLFGKLLENYQGSEASKADILALLAPLERALTEELEGQWEAIYLQQMQLSEQKMIEHDLKSARRELERARDIYVEGMTMQMRARHQREADFKLSSHTAQISGNAVTNKPKSHSISQTISRSIPQVKVVLPAQWHGMQAKIESLGAAGLALAKSRWLRYSTKLQIINGCVDFLSLSKFINNKVSTKVIQDPGTESDDDTDDKDNATGENKLQTTAEGPKYLHLDHIEVLERLRKATSLASSKVLERFKDENMKDYQLEVIDFCKVRVLSSGERIVNQGDKLPYLMIILKGRVAACLPTLQEKNETERGTTACEVAGWPLVRALVRHGERNLLKLSRTFHFGQCEVSQDETCVSKNSDMCEQKNALAHFGAWRVLGEAHVALQQPYYANLVALQDKTEILEVHVPQGGLSMVQDICNNNDGQEKYNAPVFLTQEESMGIRDVLNAEQRTAAAQNCLSGAFYSVHAHARQIETALNFALKNDSNSDGFSTILTSLSSSHLQVLIEGSEMLECIENQIVLSQDATNDCIILVISGLYTIERTLHSGAFAEQRDSCTSDPAQPSGVAQEQEQVVQDCASRKAAEDIAVSRTASVTTALFEIQAGDIFAEDSVLHNKPLYASCRCVNRGWVLKISLWAFRPVLSVQPSLLETLDLISHSAYTHHTIRTDTTLDILCTAGSSTDLAFRFDLAHFTNCKGDSRYFPPALGSKMVMIVADLGPPVLLWCSCPGDYDSRSSWSHRTQVITDTHGEVTDDEEYAETEVARALLVTARLNRAPNLMQAASRAVFAVYRVYRAENLPEP